MTILKIVKAPNQILKTYSKKVENIDSEIKRFMDDMLETMYNEGGAGLAAIQVAVPKRIMIIDVGRKEGNEERDPHFFVNPEIVWYSEETIIYPEGCLSFPGGYIEIERPRTVKVQYLDYHGNKQEKEFTDWAARAVLHEKDHLDGKVLIDYVSKLKASMFMKKTIKFQRNNQEV